MLASLQYEPQYLYEFGQRLYSAGSITDAMIVAKCLQQIDPLTERPYILLGYLNQAQEEYSFAIGAYQRAIIFNPGNIDVMHRLAQCYIALQDYGQARKWLGVANVLDEDNETIKNLMALVDKKMS